MSELSQLRLPFDPNRVTSRAVVIAPSPSRPQSNDVLLQVNPYSAAHHPGKLKLPGGRIEDVDRQPSASGFEGYSLSSERLEAQLRDALLGESPELAKTDLDVEPDNWEQETWFLSVAYRAIIRKFLEEHGSYLDGKELNYVDRFLSIDNWVSYAFVVQLKERLRIGMDDETDGLLWLPVDQVADRTKAEEFYRDHGLITAHALYHLKELAAT